MLFLRVELDLGLQQHRDVAEVAEHGRAMAGLDRFDTVFVCLTASRKLR